MIVNVSVQPRYWEDASVNGINEDDDNPLIPFKKGSMWNFNIDVQSGTILDWPQGTTARTHYKVCDAGIYTLLEDGEEVARLEGYVPSFRCPNESGYGDYIILSINESGKIEGWNKDDVIFNNEDEY